MAQEATGVRLFAKRLLDDRHELGGHHVRLQRIDDGDGFSAGKRLEPNANLGVMRFAGGLAMKHAVRFDRRAERLAVADPRLMHADLESKVTLDIAAANFEMQLAHAADDR